MNKIVVTGGAGFIGSELVRQLQKDPNNMVYVVDKLTYAANLENIPLSEPNIEFIKLDIVKISKLNSLISECEIVFHLAAESHVDRSIQDGHPFIESNILGSFEVLEVCRIENTRLVMISTDEVYGSVDFENCTETSNLNPASMYSASKAAADLLALANSRTHNQNLVITRCCNNYGINQNIEKMIPTIIHNANKNIKIPIYGNGENVREWIHVSDHVNALIKIMNNWSTGSIYNIGTGERLSNIDLVKKILSLMNKSEDLIEFVEDRKGHDFRYSLDSSKIREQIHWKPFYDLNKGLQELLKVSK